MRWSSAQSATAATASDAIVDRNDERMTTPHADDPHAPDEATAYARPYGPSSPSSATLRSTVWTLLATVVGTLLVTVLATSNIHHAARSSQGFDATNQSLTGLAIGSLTIGCSASR